MIKKTGFEEVSKQLVQFLKHSVLSQFQTGRVLLIEDSPSISMMMRTTLESEGYFVDVFTKGETALSEFVKKTTSSEQRYDLLITDIHLEGELTGLDIVKAIRSHDDTTGHVPIIAVTAENNPELRLKLCKEGVNDFIQKPILLEELIYRARNLIQNKKLLDEVLEQRKQLYVMATTDKLTGCNNRHSLVEYSEKFIELSQKDNKPASIFVIDLDHFKRINDQFGHAGGDLVLSEVGKILVSHFNGDSMAARFGGEEFVVLLYNCNQQNAIRVAEKLRETIENIKPNGIKTSASIGVSSMAQGEVLTFDQLFQAADQAVYTAKQNGRNQVQYVSASEL